MRQKVTDSALKLSEIMKCLTYDDNSFLLKLKVFLCFFLTEQHAMKMYWGIGDIAPLIL
jgi:hypothetical protein